MTLICFLGLIADVLLSIVLVTASVQAYKMWRLLKTQTADKQEQKRPA